MNGENSIFGSLTALGGGGGGKYHFFFSVLETIILFYKKKKIGFMKLAIAYPADGGRPGGSGGGAIRTVALTGFATQPASPSGGFGNNGGASAISDVPYPAGG